MKREDISKLFPDATDEQISALLDINSRDIGRAKGDTSKLQSELDAANDALSKAQETLLFYPKKVQPVCRTSIKTHTANGSNPV